MSKTHNITFAGKSLDALEWLKLQYGIKSKADIIRDAVIEKMDKDISKIGGKDEK